MVHLKLSTRSIQVSCYHAAYRLSFMLWRFGTREEGPAERNPSEPSSVYTLRVFL